MLSPAEFEGQQAKKLQGALAFKQFATRAGWLWTQNTTSQTSWEFATEPRRFKETPFSF
jgi:hypothetical protein